MPVLTGDVLGPTVRAIPWFPPLVAAVVATTVVAARLEQDAALPLEVTGILLASGLGYVLDDPAFETMGASPTPLWRRRMHRLVITIPPAVLLFAALIAWHGTAGPEETAALCAMFAGLVGLALGIAGVAARRSARGVGGIAVAPALFAALIMSTMIAPRWRPLPLGDIPGGWTPIIVRWSAAGVIGVLVLAVSSRDRARSSFGRRSVGAATSRPRPGDRGAGRPPDRRRAASAR